MEGEILGVREFLNAASRQFVLVKIDFPQGAAARSRVQNPVANDQLQKQFGVTGYPCIVLTDADGAAYGRHDGFPQGGFRPFLDKLDQLVSVRSERDQLLASVETSEGAAKLPAAKRAMDFLKRHNFLAALEQRLPAWKAAAERWDPKNEQRFVELFFVEDWIKRLPAAQVAGLAPLVRDIEDWKKKYGELKDQEWAAWVWLTLALGKAKLEDYEGALICLDEGLKLEPQKQDTRAQLLRGPLSMGLSTGTAFAISNTGHFLTHFQVPGGPSKIFLQLPSLKKLLPARLIAAKPELDLAVVKIDVPEGHELVPLDIASLHEPRRGEEVGTWGYPAGVTSGRGLKLARGGVSALPDAGNRNMLMLDLKVHPGNSGGPLCDANGNVIGIMATRTANFGEPGMAVPAKDLAAFLDTVKVAFRAAEAEKSLSWEEIDRRVSPAVALVIKARASSVVKEIAFIDDAVNIAEQLTAADGADSGRPGCYCRIYTLKLVAGRTYQIDMESTNLDSYLRLENAGGRQLAVDDDGGGEHNSRIVFACTDNALYRIIATTFSERATGPFTLKVRGF